MILTSIKVEGDNIALSAKEIKEWKDHYHKVSEEKYHKGRTDVALYYAGRRDALIDILKSAEIEDY